MNTDATRLDSLGIREGATVILTTCVLVIFEENS